jgi:hypothetical protein
MAHGDASRRVSRGGIRSEPLLLSALLARRRCYGVTVIVAAMLVTLPIDAVTATCPGVVLPVIIVTVPADTVARLVLLEVQVATLVTSSEPLHVVAVAVIEKDGSFVVIVPLVGFRVID